MFQLSLATDHVDVVDVRENAIEMRAIGNNCLFDSLEQAAAHTFLGRLVPSTGTADTIMLRGLSTTCLL
jgi:hypothetical protein